MKVSWQCLLFLLVCSPWRVPSTLAVPIQGTEPALHSTAPVPTLDKPGWRTFTSHDGNFSVLLPSAPILTTLPLAASGEVIHEYISRDGSKAYLVFYRDLPPDRVNLLGAEKVLTINDNVELKVTGSSLISDRPLTLDGSPGHETITSRRNGRMRLRHNYIVGDRFFTLDVLQPMRQKQDKPTDADKFLNSFTLLSAKLPNRK